jgi:hypothetical protein
MATILRRLDGLPSSPFTLYHDAHNVVLTTGSWTLTVAEASHVLTDAGADILIHNLTIPEGWHDHVSNHLVLGQDVNLAVADAYHLHRGDATYASPIYLIGTNPQSLPKLPDLRSEGQSGERGYTVSGGLLLPGVSVEARVGSKMVADLPELSVSASATQNTPMSVDSPLPSLEVSSRAGSRCGTLRLPTMEILASTEAVHIGNLDRRLPGIRASATARETNLSYLDADLPALQASITIDSEIWLSLDGRVPPPRLSATMSGQLTMNMSGMLPALMVVSDLGNTSLTVEGYIPPPVMLAAGEGIGGAVLEDTTRYDDQVLRHVR